VTVSDPVLFYWLESSVLGLTNPLICVYGGVRKSALLNPWVMETWDYLALASAADCSAAF